MRRISLVASILTSMLFGAIGCSRHYYDGQVAILDAAPAIEIRQRSNIWGDCYRYFGGVPTVYRLDRGTYVLEIVHGQRYWPELLLVARDQAGVELAVSGSNITPVGYKDGGDMRRLRESRGVLPGYETGRLSASSSPLQLTIADAAGAVLGSETVSFKVEVATCVESDSI